MSDNSKHIALLVDIDNVEVSLDNLTEMMDLLKKLGSLDYVKLYGFNERKHTNWGETISFNGIETCNTIRFRKRNKSQLDIRLVIDAISLSLTQPSVNAFAIIAGKGDLVPLLTSLRLHGKFLYDFKNFGFDVNGHMFNEHLEIKNEEDPQKARKKELSNQLRLFSERTAAMAMEDNISVKEKNQLIMEVEAVLREMELSGDGKMSDDVEEVELFENLENILEILKTF